MVADGVRNLEGNIGPFDPRRERSGPPGSKSGARMQKGSPETWESGAADKAAIQLVKVQSCQLLVSDT